MDEYDAEVALRDGREIAAFRQRWGCGSTAALALAISAVLWGGLVWLIA